MALSWLSSAVLGSSMRETPSRGGGLRNQPLLLFSMPLAVVTSSRKIACGYEPFQMYSESFECSGPCAVQPLANQRMLPFELRPMSEKYA